MRRWRENSLGDRERRNSGVGGVPADLGVLEENCVDIQMQLAR